MPRLFRALGLRQRIKRWVRTVYHIMAMEDSEDCEEEEVTNMLQVPIRALKPASRNMLCEMLNTPKVITTDDGYPRDWRGLGQLVGLNNVVLVGLQDSSNPVNAVLDKWIKLSEGDLPPLVGHLQTLLGKLDRWDVYDDTEPLMEKDARDYLRNLNETVEISESIDVDENVLTVGDVFTGETQYYDAFLLYADEDTSFALQIQKNMEDRGLKLCLKDRDMMAGMLIEHEVIMRLISERCRRLIVVISPSFLKSGANKFLVSFAQAHGIEKRKRTVIPVMVEQCELPPILKYYFFLDYSRDTFGSFWSKLWAALTVKMPSSRSGPVGEAPYASVSGQSLPLSLDSGLGARTRSAADLESSCCNSGTSAADEGYSSNTLQLHSSPQMSSSLQELDLQPKECSSSNRFVASGKSLLQKLLPGKLAKKKKKHAVAELY